VSRPELPEAEYRVQQWLGQWAVMGDGYAGKVLRRFVTEYDRRGRDLGLPPIGRVGDSSEGTGPDGEPCHNGRLRLQCGRCQSLIEAAADRGSA
jgi:hypothetical protein